MGWAWVSAGGASLRSGTMIRRDPRAGIEAAEIAGFIANQFAGGLSFGAGNFMATMRARLARERWVGQGIPAHYDVAASRRAQPMRFSVALRHSAPEGLHIIARSGAETFFDRPSPRKDGRAEAPHLFHPYWQARLAPVRRRPGLSPGRQGLRGTGNGATIL